MGKYSDLVCASCGATIPEFVVGFYELEEMDKNNEIVCVSCNTPYHFPVEKRIGVISDKGRNDPTSRNFWKRNKTPDQIASILNDEANPD